MKRNFVNACVVLLMLIGRTGFAASGLFFNVSGTGLNLDIRTTIPNHTYPAAGIKINTPGYTLSGIGSQCTMANNGYCLFPVSDSVHAPIGLAGPSGKVSITLCLNGKGALSCQNYSLAIVAKVTNGCGRFLTGYTGSWSTVADNPFSSGVGFSDYLPQGTAATLYLGDGSNFDSFTSSGSGGSYTTLSPPPTNFTGYGSMAYFGGSLWAVTSNNVIQYNPTTNTWTTPATGLVTTGDMQTAVDDKGNLWTWQDASTLLEYNIASGTTTTHPLFASIGNSEPRIVYDSCSGLLYLASFESAGFYSYDPSTGTVTTLSSLPASLTFEDGFCADRSGHIFTVVNGTSMYQYTISTGAWVELPAGGLIGNSNSACGVGSDDYLYASDPATSPTVYRILLK